MEILFFLKVHLPCVFEFLRTRFPLCFLLLFAQNKHNQKYTIYLEGVLDPINATVAGLLWPLH